MPSNWIGKNWLNMLSNTRMPICMKSPNILIVRQPPFAMHSNRWGWRAKKDHHLQRTRPGQSNALFDTAGRIFRLPTCLFGWNRIWPLPVPSLCPQPERANSESADKWKKIPALISGVRTSRHPTILPQTNRFPKHLWSRDTQGSRWVEPPAKKNTWLRNAKCFILEPVPTTGTLVLHLKSESKAIWKQFFRRPQTFCRLTGNHWYARSENCTPAAGRLSSCRGNSVLSDGLFSISGQLQQ